MLNCKPSRTKLKFCAILQHNFWVTRQNITYALFLDTLVAQSIDIATCVLIQII